jgi:type IX secretion system PorP/SprF family membrane protein
MKLSFSVFLIFFALISKGQINSYFGNYLNNLYLINPAAAADQNDRVDIYYKSYFTSLVGAPVYQLFSAQTQALDSSIGIGFKVFNQSENILSSTGGSVTLAYHFKIAPQHRFNLGLGFNVIHHKVRPDKIISTQPVDPVLNSRETDFVSVDGNFGIQYHFKGLVVGGSSFNLFQNSIDNIEYSLNRKDKFKLLRDYHLYGLYKYPVSERFQLYHALLMQTKQGLKTQFRLQSGMIYKRNIDMAILYSPGIGYGFGFGCLLGEKVRLGYIFDSGIPQTVIESSGSHELSLSYFFRKNTSLNNSKIIPMNNDVAAFMKDINLEHDYPEDKNPDSIIKNLPYYVVAGSFTNKKSAKKFQKLLLDESGIYTELHQDENSSIYLIISSSATTITKGKEQIRSLLRRENKGLIIKEPWIFKNKE